MNITTIQDIRATAIEQFPYKGIMRDVIGVTIRWFSKAGMDDAGNPEYGFRYLTVAPGGHIPIHNHFYVQTMFIKEGTLECTVHDMETGDPIETITCPAGTAVYTPSLEPHSITNKSTTTPAAFLCCICNVYEDSITI